MNSGIVGNVGETTIRYVSAEMAESGVQSRQKKRIAKPPSHIKIGATLTSEKKMQKITIHIKNIDSCKGSK